MFPLLHKDPVLYRYRRRGKVHLTDTWDHAPNNRKRVKLCSSINNVNVTSVEVSEWFFPFEAAGSRVTITCRLCRRRAEAKAIELLALAHGPNWLEALVPSLPRYRRALKRIAGIEGVECDGLAMRLSCIASDALSGRDGDATDEVAPSRSPRSESPTRSSGGTETALGDPPESAS